MSMWRTRRWPADGPVPAGVLLALAVVLAFAPDHFLPMLLRAFLWPWAIAGLCGALWAAWSKRFWIATSLGVVALAALLSIQATIGGTMRADGPHVLRVAQMNVLQPNDDHGSVLVEAMATGADVISLQEVDPEWDQVLRDGLANVYPYHRAVPGTNCYGIAVFSKRPFLRERVLWLCGRPVIDVSVNTGTGPLRVLAVHASSPGDYHDFRKRNAQLKEVAGLLVDDPTPTVVVGDLNTTSWDEAFVSLARRTGLREHPENTSATWPSAFGLALMPLDHVLVNTALSIAHFRTFTITGSDHRGVVADIHACP